MQNKTSLGLALSLAALFAACNPASSGSSSGPSTETAGKGGSSSNETGSGGSGGSATPTGTGGTGSDTPTAGTGGSEAPPAADASAPSDDAAPVSGDDAAPADDAASAPADGGAPAAGPGDPKTFTCNLVIGIQATGQWFNAGFEKLVDNSKWELSAVHSGFINDWADPNNKFWDMAPSSACTTNAKTPDRVIVVALYLHWMTATVDEWMTQLTAVVKNFKAKDPNLKRIEFQTFVRAPMNMPCKVSMPFKSWILPAQDMAYQKMAQMYPDIVTVSPKFEVPSCADFGGNPPHFTSAGATAAAKQIADYYNAELK